MKKIIAKVLTL